MPNFSGQKRFLGQNDTLFIIANPQATDDEIRNSFVKTIQSGLVSYVMKTDAAQYLSIKFDAPQSDNTAATAKKDPWNLWVFSVGGSGNLSGDANHKDKSLYGNISASRVTENEKISFYSGINHNYNSFSYDGKSIEVINRGNETSMEYTKGLGGKWSLGAGIEGGQSTFRNYKFWASARPKVEYSIFPYKDFNAKRIVVGYSIGPRYNAYKDTTIFFKIQELRATQNAYLNASFTQKWGNINIGVDWSNFLHDFNLNKFGITGAVEWRIVKGLKLAFYGNYDIIHNQIFLPKGDATRDAVLTKQRQIGTSFNYGSGMGLRYQFGSKNNSAVNPRFSGLNYSISF